MALHGQDSLKECNDNRISFKKIRTVHQLCQELLPNMFTMVIYI
jgi:hypothetical protein